MPGGEIAQYQTAYGPETDGEREKDLRPTNKEHSGPQSSQLSAASSPEEQK